MTVPDLTIEDVPYVVHDGEAFLARVYRARSTGEGAPAVLYVHPGAWSSGDRTWGELFNEALARRGFVVAAIDFRQAPRFRHPAASADVATGVRWLRAAHSDLGVDPGRIALVGSSSGGQLALLVACRPDAAEHEGRPLAPSTGDPVPDDLSAAVSCVAALWPPVDPLARHRHSRERMRHPALRAHHEALCKATVSYFGDEATMGDASVSRLVAAGEATHLPPAWVCHPELDANVPYSMIEALEAAWRDAGGDIAVTVYEGQIHAFGHRASRATDRFVDELAAFLERGLGARQ